MNFMNKKINHRGKLEKKKLEFMIHQIVKSTKTWRDTDKA